MTLSAFAQSYLYFGTHYAKHYEELKTQQSEAYHNTDAFNFKIGFGKQNGYAIELSLDYITNDANIFSDKDSDKYHFNLELLKAFDLDTFFYPYLKVGFGVGFMEVQRSTQSTLNFGSYNAGLGCFIPISEHVDLELGYVYKSISYEQLNLLDQQLQLKTDGHNSYAGFNFRF